MLAGLKVAIHVTDGFEQLELTEPRAALDEAGAQTRVVSPKADRVRGWCDPAAGAGHLWGLWSNGGR